MTYEERLLETATLIAKTTVHPALEYVATKYEVFGASAFKKAIEEAMPIARTLIFKEAQSFIQGWHCGNDWAEEKGEYVRSMDNTMIILGLVPNEETE